MKVMIKKGSLQKALLKKNKSQNWLAQHLQISSGYMSQLMNGARHPSGELRERLLLYFEGAEFDDLFEII